MVIDDGTRWGEWEDEFVEGNNVLAVEAVLSLRVSVDDDNHLPAKPWCGSAAEATPVL